VGASLPARATIPPSVRTYAPPVLSWCSLYSQRRLLLAALCVACGLGLLPLLDMLALCLLNVSFCLFLEAIRHTGVSSLLNEDQVLLHRLEAHPCNGWAHSRCLKL